MTTNRFKPDIRIARTAAVLLCLLLAVQFAQARQESDQFSIDESPLPPPTSPVMDYAGVLDADTKRRLEERIEEFRKSSDPSVELAVAVVRTTGDRPIFDYSLAVARGWGIGSRADDNPGALLFIAVDDRKYHTQVSRDLEDELPDGLVGSLQRQFLVPEFRQGNYSKGVEDTIEAYIRTIEARRSGETIPDETAAPTYERDAVDRAMDSIPNWLCRIFCCLAVVIVILAFISGGSGGSGGGRKRRKRDGADIAGDILGGILTGLVIGGSSGGSSSGGWSSGGSSGGWGGFGGGGDFGGGGAGGGW